MGFTIRKKINELAIQHNKLTTLVACLLNELTSVKKELHDLKSGDVSLNNSSLDIWGSFGTGLSGLIGILLNLHFQD
jgi:hypothetical protein